MKTFNKECKHAHAIRKAKWLYTLEEAPDGCWLCGGILEPWPDTRPEFFDIIDGDITEEEFERFRNQPREPQYYCKVCWGKKLEEIRSNPRSSFLSVEQILESYDEDKWKQIQEVAECGPDCPLYDRLEDWKKEYNEDGTPKNGKSFREMYDEGIKHG